MTKAEIETIQNIVNRLKEPAIGSGGPRADETESGQIMTTRIYVDTWIIGALECLLPGDGHDPELGVRLSRK